MEKVKFKNLKLAGQRVVFLNEGAITIGSDGIFEISDPELIKQLKNNTRHFTLVVEPPLLKKTKEVLLKTKDTESNIKENAVSEVNDNE